MFLYNLSLQTPSGLSGAITGNFSGTKAQEIVLAKAGALELVRPDPTTGIVHTVLTHAIFGVVRSLIPFRLTGATKDYIVVGSDSGKITILEFNPAKVTLDVVHQETFGKSGCRRIVPGEYLAMDPKGRAVMIGALEKQKLVYILNRDSAAKLTISSPLDAHKSFTVTHALAGVDVGFENPIFAALEVDYTESDQDATGEAIKATEKVLTYYELDLGLNHVVRKWSDPVSPLANHLIAVPGGMDGPSGVLVCSENLITWKHQHFPTRRIPIPRRLDAYTKPDKDRGVIIVASVVHKMKNNFFILVQSEEGDIFKITMDYPKPTDGASGGVDIVKIKYFDTLPLAVGLCLLKSGFLFLASEFGNHYLYQIENLGDDDVKQPEYSSNDLPQDDDEFLDDQSFFFHPRPLRNLAGVDELQSLSPLVDAKILNLTDQDTPQIYALCGRGSRGSFRILRHGVEVSEMAVSELPGHPSAVWTVKLSSQDQFDSYIVVSFVNATLVLSIGETVEEVTDTGFLATTPSLTVCQLGEDSLVQVYPNGIRHIRADKRVSEWQAPQGRGIIKAAGNQKQIIVALSTGELVYFELDAMGQLNEFQERKEMPATVTSLAIGPIPEGRQRSPFLAVGCADSTVRMLGLDPGNCLDPLSMQALNTNAESLLLLDMPEAGSPNVSALFLYIGLTNGVLLKTSLDEVTGELSDTRLRFLGSKAAKLFSVTVSGQSSLLALSSRPWLGYNWQGRSLTTPLSYETMEFASAFTSEQCPEGIVAIVGKTLRILTVDKFGSTFNQAVLPLKYTPRRFVLNPLHKNFVIVESDHGTYCPSQAAKLVEANKQARMIDDGSEQIDEASQVLDPVQFGLPRAGSGNWASCIRVVNPFLGETTCLLDLDENEAAFCVALCTFDTRPEDTLVVVGAAKDMKLSPRSCSHGSIHVYQFSPDGATLELLHKTEMEEIPLALCAFNGKLLAGCGKSLRLYELGKKKLLRKCENKLFPQCIVTLSIFGERILVGDVQESAHFALYKAEENKIVIFADDTAPRWTSCLASVDYDTVVGGDKFGNLFVNRLPKEISQELDNDETGNKLMFEKGQLNGAPYKMQHMCEFHIGETVTSVVKAVLVVGGRDVLVYTSLLGTIGILVPFLTKSDIDFYQQLEIHMRGAAPPLCGRDHLSYRSAYFPVKNVIDGDLCERFNVLEYAQRKTIAEDLDRTPQEVSKKLEDMRNRVAY